MTGDEYPTNNTKKED